MNGENKKSAPTREEILSDLLKTYSPLSILSQKSEKQVLLLCHRTIGRRIVAHSIPQALPIYGFLCSVRHPNLPAVYDVIPASNGAVVLEEYIEGMSVADVLASGLYTKNGANAVMRAVGSALLALHKNGYVHRDVKPENVMIGDDGGVRLIDFDAARRYEPGRSLDTSFLGTVGYAPPEQYGVVQSDPRSDVYALGVLYNVMLTGEHPSKKLAPGKAGRIVLRCTLINPEKRFESVEELLKKL